MLEKKENLISKVVEDSLAWKMGIEEGDILLKVNHEEIEDIIEYMFLISEEFLELEIRKKNGSIKVISINKEYDEDLGLEFQNPIIDKTKSCKNNCIFCFVDQLPPNMRKTLYFKDDDSRLSFLQGNFVTLTNMTDEDIDKIIRFRISPINVSIHTTDPTLRVKMLKNKKSGNVYERLKKLANAGIEINGQIVLCPNVNDNKNLDKTIKDLANLYPNISSLAIVPVGITKFRDGLYPLESFNKDQSKIVVKQVKEWQKKLLKDLGTRFAFLSDEFYVLSDEDMPDYEDYEGFPQLENGVGLIREFEHNFTNTLKDISEKKCINSKTISIVTGKSAEKFIKEVCRQIQRKFNCINFNVYSLENIFFGKTITVSGLLTGSDIINGLKDKELGDVVLIPDSMLKKEEDIFLDDFSVEDVSQILNVPLVVCPVDGSEFVNRIITQIE